ncbi:MAG: M48 family metallopeptidase [Thiotrichales bacterium]
MKQIQGFYYASGSARRIPAMLQLDSSGYRVTSDAEDLISGDLATLRFSSRLGNIPRRVELPDGAVFESEDNTGIDQALEQFQHPDEHSSRLHRIESKWRWVLVGIIVIAGFLFSVVHWGIPAASKAIANSLPQAFSERLAAGTLSTLDQFLLEPSELPVKMQKMYTRKFQGLISQIKHSPYRYRLHFRHMQDTPNAFALPAGDIVITDALITTADSPEEVEAVLLHEMGHVEHRHSLRQVISSSIVAIGSAYMTGGSTVGDEIFAGLPVFLVQQHYSRNSENEADDFAFQHMLQLGIDPINFATIMEKMTGAAQGDPSGQQVERRLGYISSHPLSTERIQKAREYSEQFRAAR